MTLTTDVDIWMNVAIPNDSMDDVYALYVAVETETRFGQYTATRDSNGQLIISCKNLTEELPLDGPSDKEKFLRRLGVRYCDGQGVHACLAPVIFGNLNRK